MNSFGIRTLFYVVALLFCSAVSAEETSDAFRMMDADGDGYISINEASGKLEMLRQWVNADKNGDGQIEFSEFSAFEGLPAATFEPVNPEEVEPGAAPTD